MGANCSSCSVTDDTLIVKYDRSKVLQLQGRRSRLGSSARVPPSGHDLESTLGLQSNGHLFANNGMSLTFDGNQVIRTLTDTQSQLHANSPYVPSSRTQTDLHSHSQLSRMQTDTQSQLAITMRLQDHPNPLDLGFTADMSEVVEDTTSPSFVPLSLADYDNARRSMKRE